MLGAAYNMKVAWKRSSDGFCESADGKWHITPLYCGCVKPQFFELWFYPQGIHAQPPRLRRKILSMESSQHACKAWVASAATYPEVARAGE